MTNNTETRLRDYLETKAGTVQGDRPAPQFDPAPRRRLWPALAAAAAVIAVVGLIVPFLLSLGDGKRPSTDTDTAPAPGPVRTVAGGKAGAVKTTRPELPFLLDTPELADLSSVLHDGATRLDGPKAPYVTLVGRVADGWVIRLGGRTMAVALLTRDGRWRNLSAESDWAYLSPDKTKVVLSRPDGKINRVVVVDIATGRELHSVPANFDRVLVHGWNPDGIWFSHYDHPRSAPYPYVWQPGSDPRRITAPGFVSLQAPGSTDRIALITRTSGRYCARVVTLRDDNFVPLRERCDQDGRTTMYPFLSPRGDVVAFPEGRIALDVDTGVVTRLNGLTGWPDPVDNQYEDADHLLVVAQAPRTAQTQGLPPEVVNRCNVRTGSCRVVYRAEERYAIDLGTP